ncbi:hypothetical protein FNV43_RR04399 [Rhamnella rubrinervis]|uniref:Uncharacterized protein n=1 Tax=Rhamnella rubrinervis TaxID=2594499 RepID=A0A8K0HJP1_9ROSA|nr:hypothetical protein FNV43_RR04399 [Rhamnella rubrinervis]
MVVVGVVGYVKTSRGLRSLNTVWAQHLNEEVKEILQELVQIQKAAFTKYSKKYESEDGKKDIQAQLDKMKKYCTVIDSCFGSYPGIEAEESPSYGNSGEWWRRCKEGGYEGVVTRWGVTRLPRKTHRGLRKGWTEWLPSSYRDEQKVYKLAKAGQEFHSAVTWFDRTQKDITQWEVSPLWCCEGGLPDDKGMCVGSKACCYLEAVTAEQTSRLATEEIKLKFIDTSSKFGHGRFQTIEEKARFYGRLKS